MDLQRLQSAYATMLDVVHDRHDGRDFLPIMALLEAEIEKQQHQEDEYARICRIAQERRGQL